MASPTPSGAPPQKRIVISYSVDDIWPVVERELNSRLPLRSLLCHTRGLSNATRLINSLDIELRRYHPDQFPRVGTGGFHQNTFFLHLFVTSCEEGEEYKSLIRRQIQDWLGTVSVKKHQEWLIVHLANQARGSGGKTFLSSIAAVGGSVPDKMKADVATWAPNRKERVLTLRLHGNESKDFECWNELTAKMKECLLSSFNMQITQADEDTRRLDQQRLMPGWNYCQFFIMKESLAFTYELMSLFEEALMHYDELEAGFFQTLSEQALPWFKKFGGTEPLDDSADVLDFNRKAYREAIYQNSTTIFDFRIYLFSKQCHLLRRLGQPLQFMTRAHSFIASFSQTLSEYRVSLIPFFKESWIYSACRSIVLAGDELMARNEQSLAVTKQYESLKANLLHLTRIQLDKLGRIYEKLNRPVHPWATELNQEDWTQIASAADGNNPKNMIFPTHPDLQVALSSKEDFDKLYIDVTAQAVQALENSSRSKTALLLKGDLAMLHYSRSRYSEATELWEPICAAYLSQGWNKMSINLIERLGICQKALKRYSRYVVSCFHMIQNPELVCLRRVDDYLADLSELSPLMDTEVVVESPRIFGVDVVYLRHKIANDDKMTIDINVSSSLSKPIHVQNIQLWLISDGIFEPISCSKENVSLRPGHNSIRLMFEVFPCSGTFNPTKLDLVFGKLVLQYDLSKNNQPSFVVNENVSDLSVEVETPSSVLYCNLMTKVAITLKARSDRLREIAFSVKPLSGLTILARSRLSVRNLVQGTSQDSELLLYQKDKCGLPDLEPDQEQELEFTCNFSPGETNFRVKLIVEYVSVDGKSHVYSALHTLSPRRLVNIRHKVIHIPNDRIVKFEIQSLNVEPLKLDQISLVSKTGEEISPVLPVGQSVIFHQQVMSYLFSTGQYSESATESLEFRVGYHHVEQDLKSRLKKTLRALLTQLNALNYEEFFLNFLREHVTEKLDFVIFAKWMEIQIPDVSSELHNVLQQQDEILKIELLNIGARFFKENEKLVYGDLEGARLKLITYPLPTLSTHARLSTTVVVHDSGYSFSVDSPIHATLIFERQDWHGTDEQDALSYQLSSSDWMICGQKSHSFFFKDQSVKRFEVLLIPLMSGFLHLPRISVQYTDPSIVCETDFPALGEQIKVYPGQQSGRIFINN